MAKNVHYMFFAIFEGTYNVITYNTQDIHIMNSALGVPID